MGDPRPAPDALGAGCGVWGHWPAFPLSDCAACLAEGRDPQRWGCWLRVSYVWGWQAVTLIAGLVPVSSGRGRWVQDLK